MTVIDLGELNGATGPTPANRIPRRVIRQLGLVGALGVSLATATTSAPQAERPAAVAVPARPDASAVVRGDLLFVVDQTRPVAGADAGEPELAAYALPAGRPLWQVPLPVPELWSGPVRAADVVLLGGLTGAVRGAAEGQLDPDSQEVVALTRANGTMRWRRPGELIGITRRGNVLVGAGPADRDGMLHSVDPAIGVDRWARPAAWVGLRTRSGVADLMLLETARRVEVRDPESGDLLGALALPPPAADQPRRAQFVGDLLLIREGDRVVTAYDVGSMTRRWSHALGPAAESDLSACGDLVCLQAHDGRLRVLDPATGQTRWEGDHLLVVAAAGDRLLLGASERPGSGDFVVVDGGTGRVRRHLGRWQLSFGSAWDEAPVGQQRLADGRQLVARLDPAEDGVRTLGAIPDVVGECQAPGSVLVCRREGGEFGVWRLDP
ncbi:PQQ-binding-like beta-propeller repeat protein [Micromonospora sp. SL1-18]|uniref:outer membrane protein assembly factor BamB family protein n=1 Tax=Micromonospora sp. SL1-18 TaxID=3399128 RepID=UPI003A4D2DA4